MKRFLLSIILAVAFTAQTFASLPAGAVWEVRQTATAGNVNGGFFNSARGGTDYSQQDAAQLHNTDGAASGTTTFTSATGGFTTLMKGNGLHIVSATGLTTGWYEIVSVTDANNVVLDASPGTGTAASFYVGGAMSLNSTLDDAMGEALIGGNIVYVKYSATAISLGQAVSIASASAVNTANIFWIGYNTTRGDTPRTEATRPTIACGANSFTTAGNWQLWNINWTGSGSIVLATTLDCVVRNCLVLNTSSVASRTGLSAAASWVDDCELVSQNGVALLLSSAGGQLTGCYVHDSDKGMTTGNTITISDCIFARNKTRAQEWGATTPRSLIRKCTIYGTAAKAGEGITGTAATCTGLHVQDCNFYGLTDGIKLSTVQQDTAVEDFNNFNNVTTPRTLIATGAHSSTVNPSFVNAVEITGTTATTSGSVLTQSGGDFSTVVDGEFLHVTAGTGVTQGIYRITSHTSTTLTVNNTLGTSSGGDVVYYVGTGRNWQITGSL